MALRVLVATMILAGKYPANIETMRTNKNLVRTDNGSATRTIVANGVSIGFASIYGLRTPKIRKSASTDPRST